MFVVDEPTAEAIRLAWDEGGELSGIVGFQRHFPLIADHAKARLCLVGNPRLAPKPGGEQRSDRSAPK